ncbi:hypothetical protein RIF29_29580 [Crotalaria pallida]|uniref:DOMON domain-containing protein n=1 Tax=Crotalaria pallida TaxID=3830 RepID=A0AAN9EGZ0_CROPI
MTPPSKFLFFLVLSLFTTTTFSSTCKKQNLTIPNTNTSYAECIDLPYLNSFLHFTHNVSKSSLSIAFLSPPATPDGWVAFGLNPVGTGMAGAQAIAAYNDDGELAVRTYDIKSYGVLINKNLSYEVLDLSADKDSRGGLMRIFATVKVPEDEITLNYVWQVGPSIINGKLEKHPFEPGNLNAMGTLKLNNDGKQSYSSNGSEKFRSNKIIMIWCFISGLIVCILLLGN